MALMGGIVAAIGWLEIGGRGLGSGWLVLALGWGVGEMPEYG
ncbi:hypothetical protein TIFTF001_002626 [Ficus carica]|uniref:Uncharacterized protein n=1 Tax=Ficus carica TaxID=3494 RepID=A0AA87ZNS9_FICCA|nr:hypothetical protein TIFTF001_002626 [Ficus carica]